MMNDLSDPDHLPNAEEQKRILEEAYSFQGRVNALKEHVTYLQEWQYKIQFCICAQGYLKEILPKECCINLAFSGDISSGKTKATKIATEIAGGTFYEGGSFAAFIRAFAKNTIVGIDEFDYNRKRLPDLEGIIVAGNTWGATYPMMRKTKDGYEFDDLEIGGPKFLNWRVKPNPALLSRTIIYEMQQHNDPRQVVANLFLENPTASIRQWLRMRSARALRKWADRNVKEYMNDPAFIARLERLPTEIGRHTEVGAIILLIADMLEFSIEEEVGKAIQSKIGEGEDYEELGEVFREIYEGLVRQHGKNGGRELRKGVTDALALVNDRRKQLSLYPLSTRTFAAVRRTYGFQDGINVIQVYGEGGKLQLIFDATVVERLYPNDEDAGGQGERS